MQPNQPVTHEPKKPNAALISLIVIFLIAASIGAVYALRGTENEQSATQSESTSSQSNATTSNTTSDASSYRDGTYAATGSYSTPGGRESVTVKLQLSNGTITSIDATGSADGGTSRQYQSEFLDNYKSQVVGKSVNEVKLSRVAGSSLTSSGFNSALDAIKDDAKA